MGIGNFKLGNTSPSIITVRYTGLWSHLTYNTVPWCAQDGREHALDRVKTGVPVHENTRQCPSSPAITPKPYDK